MKKSFSLFVAIVAAALVANAQEETTNTSNVKASDVTPKEETQKDIDQEITNARMRATLGSKSKWSIKTALGYNGGSVERPGERIRPNYRAGANIPALSTLSASVGVKYSVSASDSISAGTGLLINNPFHGALDRSDFTDPRRKDGKNVERYNASTPYVDYTRAYKVAGMQMVSSATYSHVTDSFAAKEMNAVGGVDFSQTIIADLGESSWSAGMSLSFDASIYNGKMSDYAAATGNLQDDFGYGVYPFAEYAFNDRYSFRTVFGYFASRHYMGTGSDPAKVESETPYQSMGIGMSITRDIYLYPNLQFAPLDVRPERTNVALSANLNVF